jgi:hypothetical protein
MVKFVCEHCGHEFELDESLAGRSGRCKRCGHGMTVPSAGFRLKPIEEDQSPGSELSEKRQEIALETAPAPRAREPRLELAPVGKEAEPGIIPEEFVADRAPYELDKEFEPPPSAVSPPSSPVLMTARAGWRHSVAAVLKKMAALEDFVYLALMAFWLIGAVAFLFELKPLAWTMLGVLTICSIILLLLGGFEIVVKPFKESILHGLLVLLVPFYVFYYVATRWKEMKGPFRKAIGAFGPLLILIALALFSRPIRDWFLHMPPPKKPGDAMSQSASARPVPAGQAAWALSAREPLRFSVEGPRTRSRSS